MEPNKTIRYEARTLDWWLGRLTDPTNFWIGVYNPDDDKAQVLRTYDLTPEDYDRMLASQGGGCTICGATEPGRGRTQFCVDHNHTTGHIRGLLCAHCNLALGYLKDDPNLCLKAANYLGAHV